jgi:hypothetical protein
VGVPTEVVSIPARRALLREEDRKALIEFLKKQEEVKRIVQRLLNDNVA